MSSPRIPPAGISTPRLAETPPGAARTTAPGAQPPAPAPVEISAPLSEATSRRASGKVSADERRQLVELGAAALGRVTDAVRAFHGLDHFNKLADKGSPIGERPTQLPKVLARVTQELGAIKEAATHAKPGDAGSAGLAAMMEEFLVIHAAVQRSKVEYNYEREGTYPGNMQRLQAKLGEVWALAPAFLGADEAARLTSRWLPAEPPGYTAATSAATLLDRVAQGHGAPGLHGAPDSPVTKAVSLLREDVRGADFIRDGGVFSVVLSSGGAAHAASGRRKVRVASEDEVLAAARTVLKSAGLDDGVPILPRHPGPTPSRTEEPWGLLSEALKARDFVDLPRSGGDGHSMRRWEPNLELDALQHGTRYASGGRIELKIFANRLYEEPSRRFARDSVSGAASDAQLFMSRVGFRDVSVTARLAPRPLAEASAQALATQLDTLRTTDLPAWMRPARGDASVRQPSVIDMTPREVLQTFVQKVEVQSGVHGSGREVVLFADTGRNHYFDHLRALEAAVRAVTDDPSLVGAPIRIRVDSGNEPREQHSIFFESITNEAERARSASALAGFSGTMTRIRREQTEAFAANGPAQASLTTDMLGDADGKAWREALEANLAAYFLGQGAAAPGWQRNLDALPSVERTAFLELALEYLDDRTKGTLEARSPAVERLADALGALRRLPGRVELEATTTRNGRADPTHQAHSDTLIARSLGGPALAHATAALAEARAAE